MAEHIQVFNPSSGKPYATAPTPKNSDGSINTSDNSSKIATTEWVHSMYDGQNATFIKTVNGNAPDSNGNITPAQTGCLPLTGGRMSGKILFDVGYFESYSDSNQNSLLLSSTILQDDGTNAKGSFITLNNRYVTTSIEHAGSIFLNTATSSEIVEGPVLEVLSTGICRWNRSEVFLPAGAIFAFSGNVDVPGCLICNGAAISRTTYLRLFNVIGTTYGAGDGSTTFNLPNLIDRFIQGSETAGTVKAAGLPDITATGFYVISNLENGLQGAFAQSLRQPNAANAVGTWPTYYVNFNASDSNSTYGASTTVQPPALTMRYYIKY